MLSAKQGRHRYTGTIPKAYGMARPVFEPATRPTAPEADAKRLELSGQVMNQLSCFLYCMAARSLFSSFLFYFRS